MATHSIAWLMPTTRGRNQLEQASGMIPRRANTKPDARLLGGQPDVHRERHRGAHADRRAVDGRDHGLGAVEDPQRQFAAVVAGNRVRLAALAVVEGLAPATEVGARAEARARRR